MKKTAYLLAGLGTLALILAAERMFSLALWGYWPMVLGIGFVLLWTPLIWRRTGGFWQIAAAGISGLFLGLSFYEGIFPILSFICFIPLLYVVEHYIQAGRSYWGLWGIFIWSFLLANVIATFWVMNTALAAGVFANVVNAFLMSLPIMGYAFSRKYLEPRYHWLAFLATWILFEFFHFNWDLHWPWMTLGYALSDWTWAIQWYDITGVLGGSLWVLLVNWFLFLGLLEGYPRKSNFLAAIILLILPIAFSFYKSSDLQSDREAREFLLVQPNFEPHYEKFEFSEEEQLERITRLVESALSENTEVLVLPETIFTVRLNRLEREPIFKQLRAWQKEYPQLQVVSGFMTQRVLDDTEKSTQFTRTSEMGKGRTLRWEAGNVAYYLGPEGDSIYYKSKLVPGAEFFPYYRALFVFEGIARSLGGSMEGFRTQEQAQNFGEQVTFAPIICYESIFGDYCREFVALGAEIFVVMTNDGWWDHTPGHKQHLRYAQVRAIEQRRPVARAANTGISAFIDIDGQIVDQMAYGVEGVLTGSVTPQTEVSFYSRWGDLMGRLSLFVIIVLLMQLLYRIFANKRDRAQGIDSRME